MYDDIPTLERRLRARDEVIAELLWALEIAKDSVQWMADATDADHEDYERLEFITEAISKAKGE